LPQGRERRPPRLKGGVFSGERLIGAVARLDVRGDRREQLAAEDVRLRLGELVGWDCAATHVHVAEHVDRRSVNGDRPRSRVGDGSAGHQIGS
jgi:hypothetical protein